MAFFAGVRAARTAEQRNESSIVADKSENVKSLEGVYRERESSTARLVSHTSMYHLWLNEGWSPVERHAPGGRHDADRNVCMRLNSCKVESDAPNLNASLRDIY